MQFERIRKNHKRKIIIGGLIILCIASAITITTTRAKYKLTEDIELAKGTINYKSYDFKIMAMYQSEDKTNYTEINAMPSNGYVINEEKTYCTVDNKTKIKGKIKTVNGIHGLYNITKSDKCYLYFDKIREPITIDNIIASVNPKDSNPDFSKTATTDEGVYKISDGMYGGISYYWRGAVTSNYVKFGGFCWRIIRINGDKSMRLIYDGPTCHANGTSTAESIAKASIQYNTSHNQSNYVGWTYTGTSQRPANTTSGTASNAKTQLELWYNSNLTSYANNLVDGKYCNDREVGLEYIWEIKPSKDFYYAATIRLETGNPKLSCYNKDTYSLKIGLITSDEVILAGGQSSNNYEYYLYNGQTYWTMSPNRWNTLTVTVYTTTHLGSLSMFSGVDNTSAGLRPVINLRSDTEFQADGNGTLENPYVVK